MDRRKSFRRTLFTKHDQTSGRDCSNQSEDLVKSRNISGRISSYFSQENDDDFEDDVLPNIETYFSSDDIVETNESGIEDYYIDQCEEHEIIEPVLINDLDSSPEITQSSRMGNSDHHLSPIIQPVESEDEDAQKDSPNSSICISDHSSETCSSPHSNEIIATSLNHSISTSPFKSPNIKTDRNKNSEPFNKNWIFKAIDKQQTNPSDIISVSPFKSPNIKCGETVISEVIHKNWIFKTPNNKLTSNKNEYGSDRKRQKYIKGGFAEQLEKFLSKEQSDQAIWRHQKQRLCIDESNDTKLTLQVISLQKSYSNTFVTCRDLTCDLKVILTSSFIESLKLEPGNRINIYQPWTTFKLEEIGSSVVCANFVEVIDRCLQQFPKISTCVYEWSCKCTDDSIDKPKNCKFVPLAHPTKINQILRLNQLDSILEITENEDIFLRAYVQRVFHYLRQPSITKTWSFLLQDKMGFFAELNLKFVDFKLLLLIRNAEGKLLSLGPLRLHQQKKKHESAKLFSMIHTLQNRSKITFNSYQQFCMILNSSGENFTLIDEENNSQNYFTSQSQSIFSLFQNFNEGHRYSSIVKVVFICKEKLFVTDDSCTAETHPNYVVALQTTEVIQCLNLEIGCILHVKDFQFIRGIFLLDKYTRISCLTCKNNLQSTESIKIYAMKMEKLKQFTPTFPNLTMGVKDGELFTISGKILKPDEERSFSWPVCSVCHYQTLREMPNGNLFCITCNCTVLNPVIRIQLEVFVTSQSFPIHAIVKLRLTKRTIEKLLPHNNNEYYDIECILNKQIGPLNCILQQIYPADDDSESQMYILHEI